MGVKEECVIGGIRWAWIDRVVNMIWVWDIIAVRVKKEEEGEYWLLIFK